MAKSKEALDKLTAVRFDQALLDRLAKIGEELDRSVSYMIRHAVEKFVAEYKPLRSNRVSLTNRPQ
jgi:predicted transcriptional regulator